MLERNRQGLFLEQQTAKIKSVFDKYFSSEALRGITWSEIQKNLRNLLVEFSATNPFEDYRIRIFRSLRSIDPEMSALFLLCLTLNLHAFLNERKLQSEKPFK